MKRTLLLITLPLVAVSLRAQEKRPETAKPAPPPPVVSPEVHSDHRVVFRLRAPNAQAVTVSLEGSREPLPMQKDEQGVWSVTSDPLAPDFYGYSFQVDGVTNFDPSNHAVKPNFLYRASELHVPGPQSLPWETDDIPHGELHHHFYPSGVVGDHRDYYVYTPAGYDPRAAQTYPVLYLLHGYSDDASGWSAVGRANLILDSLIAAGKAKPMLIVMPLGYGEPKILEPNSGAFRDRSITERNFDKFREALLTEVMPRVESEYRVSKDRSARAIAGLSMGGAESLLTGLNTLDRFAWIGAFSSGGFTPEFEKEFPGLDEKSNRQIKLLWIACGTEDRLIDINRDFRKWLASRNIAHADIETPGGHSWMVWRRNLSDFAQLLFR